ncbi:MAG TPA: glycosyl hydrolase [Pyrinomonadaceae bacterium]|nr:glycosyl hydrolase [Pyrinomonadaceae bacterium]
MLNSVARTILGGLIAWLMVTGNGLTANVPAQTISELQRGFERPPDDARIMMRWWWFGSSVTKPELEREMRLMKEGGVGGFEVQATYPLSPDDPSLGIRNLPYLSDDFLDALRFTSAKAKELGLRMDLTLGSGWPYGGPSVSIEDAASTLRTERVKVPSNSQRIAIPNIAPGEKLLAVFAARMQGQAASQQTGPSTLRADELRELTDIHDGAVWLAAGVDQSHEILFFIASRTGMQVKRPAVGAEGYVLNHLDATATAHYLKNVGDRLMQAFSADRPYAIFCDSLEVYNQDWTPDFLAEFQKRRGYDLRPFLPALIADIGPKTLEIRRDWGKTLTELYNERFLAPLHDWARRNHTLLRVQNYGLPAVALSGYANVDLPEGEGAQWKVVRGTRWASSASHIYGRPVTSAETWTWLHSPVFRATPLDMKAEADRHFLMGINQLIGHGWPYTPAGVDYPGWRFYAAAVFDEKNPWWIVMPDITKYLQRSSYLLRQGTAVNDVALYLPNDDGWAHFTNGNSHLIEILRDRVGADVISTILDSGYGFDFFDDDVLMKTGRIEQGKLVLGSSRYRIVVLPAVERMPLETMRKLEEFARGSGIVIATRRLPEVTPGFKANDADQTELHEIVRRLLQGSSANAHFIEDEKQSFARKLVSLLPPDMSLNPSVPEIGFVHRRTADADIYFVANTSNVRQAVKATFRVPRTQPELWDPFSGNVSAPRIDSASDAGTTIGLDLEPYASRVVVFSKRTLPATSETPTSAPQNPIELSRGWQVSFGSAAKPVAMDQLHSWTDDEATRYFSGTAAYEKHVSIRSEFLKPGLAVRLDFGEGKSLPEQNLRSGMQTWLDAPVREAAVVYINGQRAGSVWCPPYALDVTKFVRPGENDFKIVVANLALNYMAGQRLPDYRLLNLRYGERFQAQDMDKIQALPAGLLGPIRLVSIAR